MKEVCPWTYRDNDGTLKEHYEQLHAHKSGNSDEMDQFLERHNLPKLKYTHKNNYLKRTTSIK